MKRATPAVLTAVILVVACASLYFLRSSPAGGAVQPTTDPAPDRQAPGTVTAAEIDTVPIEPLDRKHVEVAQPQPPEVELAAAPQEEAEPDLEQIDWIEVLVVDEKSQPIADAQVRIAGMRSETDPGSWYGYRGGEVPEGTTDREGSVRLGYWVWVNRDGRTREVDLMVSHPDFITFRDSSFSVGPGEHKVVLRRGPTVVVEARFGSPAKLVSDVRIQLDDEAELPQSAWTVQADGRLTTRRIPPGPRLMWIEYESEDHGLWRSEVESFELAEDGYVELYVELRPAERLVGELDPTVPRPIQDGHVMLAIQHGEGDHEQPSLSRIFETTVDEQGAFQFEDLPRGAGQVFASCRGWTSKRVEEEQRPDFTFGDMPDTDMFPELHQGSRRSRLQLQRVSIPTEFFTIEMEQSGSVEIVVKLQDGTPLRDATAGASPNVRFEGVGSIIAPWREWRARTDHEGRARIEDLPPSPDLWIHAAHSDYRMTKQDRTSNIAVSVSPGETTRYLIVLEPK